MYKIDYNIASVNCIKYCINIYVKQYCIQLTEATNRKNCTAYRYVVVLQIIFFSLLPLLMGNTGV